MTSIKKFAQVCQGGTRQILKVDILYYHFQQKNCIYTQFDGHAMVLLDYMGFAPTWLRQVSLPPPASQNHFNHCTALHCCQTFLARRSLAEYLQAQERRQQPL